MICVIVSQSLKTMETRGSAYSCLMQFCHILRTVLSTLVHECTQKIQILALRRAKVRALYFGTNLESLRLCEYYIAPTQCALRSSVCGNALLGERILQHWRLHLQEGPEYALCRSHPLKGLLHDCAATVRKP